MVQLEVQVGGQGPGAGHGAAGDAGGGVQGQGGGLVGDAGARPGLRSMTVSSSPRAGAQKCVSVVLLALLVVWYECIIHNSYS